MLGNLVPGGTKCLRRSAAAGTGTVGVDELPGILRSIICHFLEVDEVAVWIFRAAHPIATISEHRVTWRVSRCWVTNLEVQVGPAAGVGDVPDHVALPNTRARRRGQRGR